MIATFLFTIATTLSIEDYITMPAPQTPRLSPDGKQIAYVLSVADIAGNTTNADVWLINADGTGNHQMTRGAKSDNHPRWSPDGKTLAFLSDRDGGSAIYLMPVAGGEAERLAAARTFEWSPDGTSIAYLVRDEPRQDDGARVEGANPRWVHLFIVDVATRKVRRLTSGAFTIWDFDWSPDGRTIAFSRGPGVGLDDMYRTDIYAVPAAGGEPRPLVVQPGIDRGVVFSPDGKSLAFTSTGGVHDWLREHHLHVLDLATGAIRKVSAEYDRTPEAVFWSSDSKTLWFGGPQNTTSQLFRLDSKLTNVSNHEGLVDDVDIRGNRAVFTMQSLTSPPELYVSELTKFAPRRLTNLNTSRHAALGETRVIRWKNPKDGLEIEGLLTLPVGYTSGRRVPLLTFVHGGPASRFDQGYLGYLSYIYVPQVMASKGYAILRPNPRGTGGYGERFRMANRNDWGGLDWIDINAGIDQLIDGGIADPDRLGIMGWSYGGFMTTWAAGHSDRFKAISIGAPVVDLLSFHGTTDIRDFIPFYFSGPPLSLDRISERSPLRHLKPVKAPILIQHGESDERVPPSQGLMLYRVLQELGADVTLVTYPRTPHTPREPKLRLDAAQRNVEFFTKHVPAN